MANLKGVDISNWQADLNAGKIKADFVISKATEGVGYVNPACDRHIQQALKAGKRIGVYHFARNTQNSAKAEAEHFLKHTQGYWKNKGCVLVLDWEDVNTSNVAWAKEWLDIVAERTGIKPLIYMSESVVNAHNWSSVVKGDYGLWVARYRDYAPDVNYDMSLAGQKPSVKWWPFYAMWQWTSSGRLDGYGGNLDLNEFYGDTAVWDAYAGGKKAPGTTPKPSQPAPSKPAPAPTPRKSYVVKSGDTASGIAAAHGMSLAQLKSLNPNAGHPAGNLDMIRPGDVFVVSGTPVKSTSSSSKLYITVPSGVGGYLSSLAAKYGTSVAQLVSWNKNKYPGMSANYVQAGWYIRVR